ncbi:MAG: HEAT repeat domain-containing protein [Pseudomonadota bacterium]
MKLLAGMQAEKLIAELTSLDGGSPEQVNALVERIAKLGGGAVPRLLGTLADADRQQMMLLIEPLGRLLDEKSLRHFRDALRHDNPKVVQGAAWAMASRRSYDPNNLLDLLEDQEVARSRLLEVLDAQKDRLDVRQLLRYAYEVDGKDKEALLRILSDLATESLVPDLLDRLTGSDRDVRRSITEIVGRFPRDDVASALARQLDDQDRGVRSAAIRGMARMPNRINITRLCQMLTDPDVDVQNAAVEVITELNHPETTQHLVAVLKDENEYARRSAVEVLNEIGTAENVKDLLSALRDDDWWVRSRATDALASIGGPRVVDAVLSLFNDPDEEIRRAVIEILNTTEDKRALDYLIKATQDDDWWVRERAADALAKIGDRKAVPALVNMLRTAPSSAPAVIRALASFGDRRVVPHLMPLIQAPDKSVKIEAINTVVRLADKDLAPTLRTRIAAENSSDTEVILAIKDAVRSLDQRFPDTVSTDSAAQFGNPSRTLLAEVPDADQLAALLGETVPSPTSTPPPLPDAAAAASRFDIAHLNPGDMIDGRYEFIKQIGRGAFGTVLLVSDTVVDEKLVLKFLNKSIANDQETMRRFVQEVRLARKITHRNVIRLYDFLSLEGLNAISMEYFPSNPLTAEVADRQPVPMLRALRIAHDVALGMTVAHQEQIVHRDLKPANILVNQADLVKIVDFGVSSVMNAETDLTKTGYVIGSPKYMAPEQILGKEIDQRVDIYALGVILYELLTGRPPYAEGDQMAVMYAHVQGTAKPVDEVNPDLPESVSELVKRLMMVQPDRRYQTMEYVTRDLSRLMEKLSDQPAEED